MIKNYVDLKRNEKFEIKIRIAYDFHSAKYEFKPSGRRSIWHILKGIINVLIVVMALI